MNYNFCMPTRILSGKYAIKNNSEVFLNFGNNCIIVTGENSAKKSGALDDIIEALTTTDINYKVFDEITPNPKTTECYKGGQVARDYNADFIIGVGGGSVLDAAKAIAVYATNKHISDDMIYSEIALLPPLPLILIGTTAGTGSEITGVSVLTMTDGKKRSVNGLPYYAKLSFADPQYTYSLPYDITVSTALDAFSHATESWFSNKLNYHAKLYASDALVNLWSALKYFYETKQLPDINMRNELYYASLSAGMAINICGTCFPHTMSYALTENYNIPHGFACSVFLPSFLKWGLEYKNDLSVEFFSLLNTNYLEFEKIITSLVDIGEIKMSIEDIKNYSESWDNIKNFFNSPGSFTKGDAQEILKDLFCKE